MIDCNKFQLLCKDFFERDTSLVAQDLIGCEIVQIHKEKLIRVRIVETEAYLGSNDSASHSSKGITPRTKIMFGPPGKIYVYFIYGNYFMLNFVTEKSGTAGAVLIRAVEPLEGVELIQKRRQLRSKNKGKCFSLYSLTSGPAKLAIALGIDKSLNGKDIQLPHLAVFNGKKVQKKNITVTKRIGISTAQDLLLRFYETNNPFVSKA